MVASRTVLRHLRRHKQYLASFPSYRAARFEHLVADTFGRILFLPLQSADTADDTVINRVLWHGTSDPIDKAPGGQEDAVAVAHGYHILIEPTRWAGTKQWSREFGPCCDHYEVFCAEHNLPERDVYVALVAPTIARRTWNSVRGTESNWLLMKVSHLATVLETSILAPTLNHSQFRQLLNELVQCCRNSESLKEFETSANGHVSTWQTNVLKTEGLAFLGIRSYKAMESIGSTHIGIGEIAHRVRRDPVARRYHKLGEIDLGREKLQEKLEDSLLKQGLGCHLGRTVGGERLIGPVSMEEIRRRNDRMADALEVP